MHNKNGYQNLQWTRWLLRKESELEDLKIPFFCQDKADNFPWSLLEVSKMFWYVVVSEVGLWKVVCRDQLAWQVLISEVKC